MKKICGISTKAVTIRAFMIDNLKYVADNGYESFCISNPSEIMTKDLLGKVHFIPVEMQWGNVSPFELLKQIYRFYKIFRKERFDVIQFATANAGLYAAIAGWLARVPVRVFLQWGIAYPDYTGPKLWFYRFMEKLTCTFSTHVQPDSFSNLNFAISEKLFKPAKGSVVYNGSACGVNLTKFNIDNRLKWRNEVFEKYNLNQYKKVFGFVGRIVPEKGINELIEAFLQLEDHQRYALMLVGSAEEVNRLDGSIYEESKKYNNIFYTGRVSIPERYFSAFDFMVLPSYREGFGMVVLEAAAMGTPSIISNIKGPTDFVVDGYNGLICEVQSVDSLYHSIIRALEMNEDAYTEMSKNAYRTVKDKFDSEAFKKEFLINRNQLLEEYERRNPST